MRNSDISDLDNTLKSNNTLKLNNTLKSNNTLKLNNTLKSSNTLKLNNALKSNNTLKLTVSAMYVAVTVVLSTFSIPVGVMRCYPIQHFINVLSAVTLGPAYGVMIAFVTSLIRNILGTGTLLAFPGSMVGALCCGLIFKYTGKYYFTYLAEIIGTGVIGGLIAFPVATLIMGKNCAFYAFVLPFLVSTAGGTIMAAILISVLLKIKAVSWIVSR